MEILNIEQNTDNWLEGRKKVIGGSDVPILMGLSPYKTRYVLWCEKLGKIIPNQDSYIFQKGHVLEDRARVIYELTYDIDIPPKVVKHNGYKWAQVSLDGLNQEKRKVVEIKYVGEKVFNRVVNEGYVPEHYYPQLQYQLFCTGYDSLDFVCYSEKRDKIIKVEVPVDMDYIPTMVAHCEDFYCEMINKIPPRLSDQDYKKIHRATVRRSVEAVKKLLLAEYPGRTFFQWDGIKMELIDDEKKEK